MQRSCCDSRKGLTLLELTISATLILLVLGLGASFLLPLLRMQVKGAERAELQQRASVLTEELRRDLSQSNAAGVSLFQQGGEMMLAVHLCENVAQDGTLVWKDRLSVHHWSRSTGRWTRGQWVDPQRKWLRANAPTRLAEGTLRRLLAEVSDLRLTTGVREVAISHPGSEGSPQLPLSLGMSLSSPAGESLHVRRTLGGRLPAL
jgi:hypothetical protein